MQTLNTAPTFMGEKSRLPSLTGMRFIAAFLVLLCHIGISLAPRLAAYNFSALSSISREAGAIGVSFFFVLSGFILTWVFKPGDTPVQFWRRRLAKIAPNNVVTLIAASLLMLSSGIAVTVDNTVPTLFLVQTWFPSQNVILNFGANSPTWSLTCEAFFYLCFPLLILLAGRIRAGRLWGWVIGTVACIVAIPFLAQLLPALPHMELSTDSWWRYWFVYYFPVTRMLEFILGILMARIVLERQWIGLRLTPAILLAVAGFALGAYLPDLYGSVSPTALPLALVIAAAATADVQGRRTPFRSRTFIWLGNISYAFYMVHFLVVSYGPIDAVNAANWTKPMTVGAALIDTVLTFLISLALAWLLYVVVERPVMRRWGRASSAPPPVAAPAVQDNLAPPAVQGISDHPGNSDQ